MCVLRVLALLEHELLVLLLEKAAYFSLIIVEARGNFVELLLSEVGQHGVAVVGAFSTPLRLLLVLCLLELLLTFQVGVHILLVNKLSSCCPVIIR